MISTDIFTVLVKIFLYSLTLWTIPKVIEKSFLKSFITVQHLNVLLTVLFALAIIDVVRNMTIIIVNAV
jgi:hypothetical protein